MEGTQKYVTIQAYENPDSTEDVLAFQLGAAAELLEVTEHWWRMRIDGNEGWVAPEFVKPASQAQPPPLPPPRLPGAESEGEDEAPSRDEESKDIQQPVAAPADVRNHKKQAGEPSGKAIDDGAFYSTLAPFTVVDVHGNVSTPFGVSNEEAPNLPEDATILSAEEIQGPAVVSHDYSWRHAVRGLEFAERKTNATQSLAEKEALVMKQEADKEHEEETKIQRLIEAEQAALQVVTKSVEELKKEHGEAMVSSKAAKRELSDQEIKRDVTLKVRAEMAVERAAREAENAEKDEQLQAQLQKMREEADRLAKEAAALESDDDGDDDDGEKEVEETKVQKSEAQQPKVEAKKPPPPSTRPRLASKPGPKPPPKAVKPPSASSKPPPASSKPPPPVRKPSVSSKPPPAGKPSLSAKPAAPRKPSVSGKPPPPSGKPSVSGKPPPPGRKPSVASKPPPARKPSVAGKPPPSAKPAAKPAKPGTKPSISGKPGTKPPPSPKKPPPPLAGKPKDPIQKIAENMTKSGVSLSEVKTQMLEKALESVTDDLDEIQRMKERADEKALAMIGKDFSHSHDKHQAEIGKKAALERKIVDIPKVNRAYATEQERIDAEVTIEATAARLEDLKFDFTFTTTTNEDDESEI